MKRLLFVLFLSPFLSFSQIPNGVSYQAVATDLNGVELVNQNISIKASILSGTATGNEEYVEEHVISTDDFGLFTINIGEGVYISGSVITIKDIDWGGSSHFLKIEMDDAGGNNYTHMGTSQIMTVPYAYYAEEAGKLRGGNGSSAKTLIYLGGF
jgi:hypothetical protein